LKAFKQLKSKKAISPVIAVLLMVAIAVAASILVYVWSMGLVGALQGTGGQQTREQLIVEAYNAKTTTGTIIWTLYIRNVGPTGANISAVYVEGVPAANFGGNTNLNPGAAGTLTVTVSAAVTIAPGAAYTVKIVTTSGAVFSYSVIAGRAA
jgi:flagellin-like protein